MEYWNTGVLESGFHHSILPSAVDMDLTDHLITASREAMERAYAPYSGFRVGAAVLGGSGKLYSGCNVENASYGLSICAERNAIFRAVCEGEREIRAVAICASSEQPAFPCGACRQVIAEFAPPGETVEIHLVSAQGVQTYTLEELLPHRFTLECGGLPPL